MLDCFAPIFFPESWNSIVRTKLLQPTSLLKYKRKALKMCYISPFNLEIFWDLMRRWQPWPGGPLHWFVLCITCALFPQPKDPSDSHSCSDQLTIGLLQCFYQRLARPKVTACPKCSSKSSNAHLLCQCVIAAMWAVLAATWLLVQFKMLIVTYKTLCGLGPIIWRAAYLCLFLSTRYVQVEWMCFRSLQLNIILGTNELCVLYCCPYLLEQHPSEICIVSILLGFQELLWPGSVPGLREVYYVFIVKVVFELGW